MITPIRLHVDDPTGDGVTRLPPEAVLAPKNIAPVREEPLPVTGKYPPLFAVLGAHGGAGTSTLATWWAPAADTGLAWPASAATTQQVVVAARLCLPGLIAAADRLREWHAGQAPDGITVIGLVLTAARPGSTPGPVRRYRAVVAELVEHVYDIGWHDELITRELSELAEFTPHDPPPPRRRANLHESVPADVHRAGAEIVAQLRRARKDVTTQPDSENY